MLPICSFKFRLFEEEGLEIELTTGQGRQSYDISFIRQADIGFAGPEAAIYVYNEGKDYGVVFAQLTKRDGSFLWEEKQKKILNGKILKAVFYWWRKVACPI